MKTSVVNTKPNSYYKCELCKDTTWIQVDNHYKRCTCFGVSQSNDLFNKAGIKIQQKTLTFSNFRPHNSITESAKKAAIAYVQNFTSIKNNRYNSLLFLGQVGSGKTHLTIAIALNLLNKGIDVMYMPYRETMTSLKQSIMDKDIYNKTLYKYKKASLLLIDDLFKGKTTESDISILFEIINYRYMNNLPILISSELTSDKILKMDEGLGSRILEMSQGSILNIIGMENNYRINNYAD